MNDDPIARFIDQKVQEGHDVVYLIAAMLGRLVVVNASARWHDGRLDVSVDVNPELPLDRIPDEAVELFLAKAEGRPSSIDPGGPIGWATVEWPHNDWVWRIEMDEGDQPSKAVPAIAALLARLPGCASADVRLHRDDVPFTFRVVAEGEEMHVVGELGGASFETRCPRMIDALLGTIQDVHDGCEEQTDSVN